MMYDLIVFDWDGTLVDSTGLIAGSIRGAAEDLGLSVPSWEQASHVIGLGLQDALRHAVPDLPQEQMRDYIDRYRVHFLAGDAALQPFEGIVELLNELSGSGARLAIATGKSRTGLDRALQQTGWTQLFEATRCADEGQPKPHPWMLHDLARETGVATERMLMIGDTSHDLIMARSARASSLGVLYGAHPDTSLQGHGALATLASVQELSDWLRQHALKGGQSSLD